MLLYGGLLVIFLLYCVPSTAITGQTLGMKLRRVRVVRLDGSKVGWAGAFARFVIPLAVALLLPQLGAIIGLGMVLWFLRDKNRQGVHDKLAAHARRRGLSRPARRQPHRCPRAPFCTISRLSISEGSELP